MTEESPARAYQSCQVIKLAPFDVLEFKMQKYTDNRGYFLETYRERDIKQAILDHTRCPVYFVQDNESYSKYGVVRGLHYQHPMAQGKLVRVAHGKIFDVAVNMIEYSPNFGKWISAVLSSEEANQLWIPPGYAHGFQVLSPEAIVSYKVTDYYNAAAEQCLLWSDPTIGIRWPVAEAIVSEKDRAGLPLSRIKRTFISGVDL